MQLFSRGGNVKFGADSHQTLFSPRRLPTRLNSPVPVHTSNRCKLLLLAAGKDSSGKSQPSSKSKASGRGGRGSSGFGGAGRGSGGRNAGRGAGRSGGRAAGNRSNDTPAQQQRSYITSPVQVELLEELTKTEFTEAPKWDTWCNLMSGEWVGVYAAYTPWAGLPEAVWMDERGKYIHTVLTRCLEEKSKGMLGGNDQPGQQEPLLLRKLARGTTPASLKEIVINPSRRTSTAARPHSSSTSDSQQQARGPQLSSAPTGTAQEQSVPEQQQQQQAEDTEGEEEGSVEVEALSYNSEGVVVFDGGHYSAGPEYIGPPTFKMLQEDDGDGPDEEGEGEQGTAAAPTTTSIFETCLVDWSTRSRVRLKLTLRIGHNPDNEEVEVQVLRLVLFRECWAGPPGLTQATDIEGCLAKLAEPSSNTSSTGLSSTLEKGSVTGQSGDGNGNGIGNGSGHDVPTAGELSRREQLKAALKDPEHAPRAVPASWQGDWKVFTVSATAIEENDIMTGDPMVTWVYMTNEDKQAWQPSSAPNAGDAGGALWLPGGGCEMQAGKAAPDEHSDLLNGVVCSFSMVDFTQDNDEGEDEEDDVGQQHVIPQNNAGGSTVPARGFRLGMSWQLPSTKGQVLSVERDYDGAGMLRGVRYSTAVKGGWSGGKM